MLVSIAWVALGLALLVVGGEMLLRGAVGLAMLLRLTPAIIGLTVVAAGTSVPELAVSAIAAWKGSTDIAVGNVVGSNIINVTLIVGLAALVRPLVISGNTIKLEYPVMALVTLMCIAVLPRWQRGSNRRRIVPGGACRVHRVPGEPGSSANERGRSARASK
jgi:cation:H+ antiporter